MIWIWFSPGSSLTSTPTLTRNVPTLLINNRLKLICRWILNSKIIFPFQSLLVSGNEIVFNLEFVWTFWLLFLHSFEILLLLNFYFLNFFFFWFDMTFLAVVELFEVSTLYFTFGLEFWFEATMFCILNHFLGISKAYISWWQS